MTILSLTQASGVERPLLCCMVTIIRVYQGVSVIVTKTLWIPAFLGLLLHHEMISSATSRRVLYNHILIFGYSAGCSTKEALATLGYLARMLADGRGLDKDKVIRDIPDWNDVTKVIIAAVGETLNLEIHDPICNTFSSKPPRSRLKSRRTIVLIEHHIMSNSYVCNALIKTVKEMCDLMNQRLF